MFGLPEQSLSDWQRSVDAAIALAPAHLSAYALTIERGTPFGALDRAGRLPRAGDDAVAAMFEWGRDALTAAGSRTTKCRAMRAPGAARATTACTGRRRGRRTGRRRVGVVVSPLADGTGWRFANPRATATYLKTARAAAAARRRSTSSGAPPPISRTRRSGSAYAPSTASTVASTDSAMVATPPTAATSRSSAASAPDGWSWTNSPAPDPRRLAVRRRSRGRLWRRR